MMKKCTGRNGRNGKTFATYAISATANFYTSGMVCRGMDAESCPNDGTKMHNVNFTKNDVRNVRNVRILRFLTFLNANFHTSG